LTSLAADAERTRQMVQQVEGPVLLVGHSYGGAVITEAGDLPNVAGLVYVAAFAPDSDGYLWIKPELFRESFAQDLSEEEGLVMAVTQKAPLGSTFGDQVTSPAWREKPSWYQVSTEDRMIHPDNQRRMAARLGPRAVIELDASHASLASQPGAVVDLIVRAADELAATGE
jgi:pimeloyl-ACP methyl ester carboxylesterase